MDFQTDGTSTTRTAARIRVLSEAGVQQFGILEFPYNGANETLKIDYVRVQKPDGTLIETPAGSMQDMPAEITRQAPMYSDFRQRHVPVKGLSVGDVLEYQTEDKVLHPVIDNQFWFEYTFTTNATVKEEGLEVSFPKDKYVQVKSSEARPEISEQGGRKIYNWKHENSAAETHPGSSSAGSSTPSVEITTFRNWQEVGRWWGALEEEAAQPTPEVRAKAAALTAGLKTEDQKVDAIYHYVSTQFRYISISFGIGRYKPHSANEVLSNLYGDCKDKHTLLASLLAAAGIDAFPALINSVRKIDPDVPSPGQFDHVISAVPEGQKLLWLDTTAEVAPPGFLMRNLRGKQALLIPASKNPVLVETPADPPFRSTQTFNTVGTLGDDGTFTGRITTSARGDYGVALRILFFMTPQSQWQNLIQRLSRLNGFGGDVSNVSVGDPEDTSKAFEYSYDYTRKSYADWANKRVLPALPPISLADWEAGDTKSETPFQLGSPIDITFTSRITLPKGYTPTLPAAVNLSRPFADYRADYSDRAGVFITERHVTLKQREVASANRAQYEAFVKAARNDQDQYIPLLAAGSAVKAAAAPINPQALKLFAQARDAFMARDLGAAAETLEQAVKLDPKYAQGWFALGGVYLGLGRLDDGESALRTAIRLQPKAPGPYMILGSYLARTGHEEAAIQLWRDLQKQDPGNSQAHIALGDLLLREKKFGDALPELESAVKQNGQSAMLESQLSAAALGAGKTEEGIAAAKAAVKLNPTPDALNDAAYGLAEYNADLPDAQSFAEKAVRMDEASAAKIRLEDLKDSDLALMPRLAAEWDTLGWVYYREGKFQQAQHYLQAAWGLDQEWVIGNHLGQVYEKLGRRQAAIHMFAMANACPTSPTDGRYANLARFFRSKSQLHAESNQAAGDLSKIRSIHLGKISSQVGSAEFFVLLSMGGKVDGIRFASGSEGLRPLAKAITAAHFKLLLPDNAPTRIIRRGVLTCIGTQWGCDFTLFLPHTVQSIH